MNYIVSVGEEGGGVGKEPSTEKTHKDQYTVVANSLNLEKDVIKPRMKSNRHNVSYCMHRVS